MADFVITANSTFKDIAVSRGGKAPSLVEVVYGVPDRKRIHRVEPEPGVHGGRKFVLGYLGIINEQDGVDHLVRAVADLVKVKGFRDFRAVVVGSGPALELVRALACSLKVEDFIISRLSQRRVAARAYQRLRHRRHPRSAQRGQRPHEHEQGVRILRLGIPTACYPLKETKRLLGEAGVYAPSHDPEGLAEACLKLMRDEALRARSAAAAAKLSAEKFLWENEARKYVATYERVLGAGGRGQEAQDRGGPGRTVPRRRLLPFSSAPHVFRHLDPLFRLQIYT